MERVNAPQYPSLELGRLRIPGPAIPIILVGFPLIVRPRILRHLKSYPAFKECLSYSVVIVHLLLYIYNALGILNKKEAGHDNTLPLLEFLSLVLSEAALKESNFWLYTSVAVGWILVLPHSPFSQVLALRSTRAWISLVLSIPSALRMSEQLSKGATLSALSLLTRMTFLVLTGSIAAHGSSATTFAGVLLPILARPCYATFSQIARSRPWFNGLDQALQSWLRSVQQDSIGGLRTGQCIRCAQSPVAVLTLQGAGWILSSFIWSYFRWRWLFSGQASRAPSWTVFSFAGGALFFSVQTLIKLLQVREPTANSSAFIQRQLVDNLVATWWTSCMYLLLWLICEIHK